MKNINLKKHSDKDFEQNVQRFSLQIERIFSSWFNLIEIIFIVISVLDAWSS